MDLDFLFRPRAVDQLDMAAELVEPVNPDARALLDYWRTRRGADGVVPWAAIRPADIVRLLPSLFLVEPVDGDWRLRLIGTDLCARFGADLTGRLIGPLFAPQAGKFAVALYSRVAANGKPYTLRGRYVDPAVHYGREGTSECVHLPVRGRDRRTMWVLGGLFFEAGGGPIRGPR